MVVDANLLAAGYGLRLKVAEAWVPPLRLAMELAKIDTKRRVVDFLAQIGHESGRLKYTAEIWGPTAQQLRYERDFRYPWNGVRGGVNRLAFNLGNSQRGDGSKFRGYSLIQTTGRANVTALTASLKSSLGEAVPNFAENPELLRDKIWAALAAANYWDTRNLNKYADSGDFITQTERINGGTNGIADRQLLRARFTSLL